MKTIWYGLGFIALAGIVWFAYYAISPLFTNIRMNEPPPVESEKTALTGTEVKGTPAHPASGIAKIIPGEGKNYLRYEDFKTINGPDLYVYLSKDLAAKDYVNLGRIKATEGNVNYEIPAGTDAGDYRYALVWCKAFGVLFNYADFSEI